MSAIDQQHIEYHLLRSNSTERGVREALSDLFAGDGTIYLVVGFFTYNGYRTIRDDIQSFLERSKSNQLKLIVGPAIDQFSPRIASDLWKLNENEQVDICSFRHGLHAKLYFRDGPNPHVILSSANLTQVGFRYNLELGIEIRAETRTHPHIQPFIDWVDDIAERSETLRRRDLFAGMQLWNSLVNWSNKARLLPPRHIAKRVGPIVLLLIVVGVLMRFV